MISYLIKQRSVDRRDDFELKMRWLDDYLWEANVNHTNRNAPINFAPERIKVEQLIL